MNTETRYARFRRFLGRYISPLMVNAAIERSIRARGLDPARLSSSDVEAIAEDCMVALRLFVDADELPDLMVELAEFLIAEGSIPDPVEGAVA